MRAIHILHENPEWLPPLRDALEEQGPHDVLGLDRRDDQPAVDEDANLTSRQIQSDFGF